DFSRSALWRGARRGTSPRGKSHRTKLEEWGARDPATHLGVRAVLDPVSLRTPAPAWLTHSDLGIAPGKYTSDPKYPFQRERGPSLHTATTRLRPENILRIRSIVSTRTRTARRLLLDQQRERWTHFVAQRDDQHRHSALDHARAARALDGAVGGVEAGKDAGFGEFGHCRNLHHAFAYDSARLGDHDFERDGLAVAEQHDVEHRFVFDGGRERADEYLGFRKDARHTGGQVNRAILGIAHADHDAGDLRGFGQAGDGEVVCVAVKHGDHGFGVAHFGFAQDRGISGVAGQRNDAELIFDPRADQRVAVDDRD